MCVRRREDIKRGEREGEGEKENGGAERDDCAVCVNECSDSTVTFGALFCLCVHNESSVIGQVDVVSGGGRGNTLQ